MTTNEQETAIKAVLEHTFVSGLDTADALSRLNNSASIYMRIIHSFTQNMPANLAALANPTAETLPEYAIRVHGCKGSLYGIGANQAGDEAKALELAAKAADLPCVLVGNDNFIAQVEALLEDLCELEKTVEQALANATTKAATKLSDAPFDAENNAVPQSSILPAPDKTTLQKLLDATCDYDIDVIRELIDELSSLQYESGSDDILYIKEQFDTFSYEEIEQRLRQMLA